MGIDIYLNNVCIYIGIADAFIQTVIGYVVNLLTYTFCTFPIYHDAGLDIHKYSTVLTIVQLYRANMISYLPF